MEGVFSVRLTAPKIDVCVEKRDIDQGECGKTTVSVCPSDLRFTTYLSHTSSSSLALALSAAAARPRDDRGPTTLFTDNRNIRLVTPRVSP